MSRILQNTRVIELGVSIANINARDLNLAVAALAQEAARNRVEAAAETPLTDSTGGTADTTNWTLPVGTFPPLVTADGVANMAPKAGFDSAVAAIDDGQSELETKINALMVAVGTHRRISGLSAATDGTLAAVTHLLTGVATTTCVAGVSARSKLTNLRNNMAMLAAACSYVRIACGLKPLVDLSGGILAYDTDPDTIKPADTGATGSAVTTAASSIAEVVTENYLLNLKNHLATLAAAVNEVCNLTAYNGGPFVVATSSPAYKFKTADSDFSS